jgi:hypothetical protein
MNIFSGMDDYINYKLHPVPGQEILSSILPPF